jgi:hypothetical protein
MEIVGNEWREIKATDASGAKFFARSASLLSTPTTTQATHTNNLPA